MRSLLPCMCILACLTTVAHTRAEVWLKGAVASTSGKNLLVNPGLEEPGAAAGTAAGWQGWQQGGYKLDETVAHDGHASARCTYTSDGVENGIRQDVTLNQTQPEAILARVWSRAQDVGGGPDADYSLYLDLEYTDGTPLWGQTFAFNVGTHGWQQGTVLIMPAKPVKSLTIYGIFRRHKGTVWFDDFELYEMPGAGMFDMQPAMGSLPVANARWQKISLTGGPDLLLDPATGAMSFDPARVGGIILRDATSGSSFVRPALKVEAENGGWRMTGEALQLKLAVEAHLRSDQGALRLDATVRDLSGKDRAITAFWALPLPAGAWTWQQDARTSYEVSAARSGQFFIHLGSGSNGQASKYPLGAVTDKVFGLGLGTPIMQPRLVRFAMDGPRRTLYAACDVGLSSIVKASPSAASFSFQLFGFAPAWGFRAALQRYYDLNPTGFKLRVKKQGIWMPFVDISTVQGWQDFGFQYQEGAPNAAWDQAHGIYSFPYIEPLSFWMSMPKNTPHTVPAALKQLDAMAAAGNPRAEATKNCAFVGPDGQIRLSIQNAPWCDGAVFINNASPGITGTPEDPWTQYKIHEQTVKRILSGQTTSSRWVSYGDGYTLVHGAGRNGSAAAFCNRVVGAGPMGATQSISLQQKTPTPIVVTAWSKADGVTGGSDNDYSVYVDVTYQDDTHLFGQVKPFSPGTHDWQEARVRIEPAKPVRSLALNLLFRGKHTGKVWFDDVAVREEGSDRNFVREPGFEGTLQKVRMSGLYLDSFEMACKDLDYSRAHMVGAELPLIYDRTGHLCQLGYFISMEMMMDFARQIHDSGRLMFANAALWNFPWCAGYLDVMGTETNWLGKGDKYTPVSDEQMLYWRAMCYKRPYVTLQNTVFEKFPHAMVEKYFARCCYYGVLPSFFSHNAADAVYWNRPELYNRDRDLFRKYIPVLRTIAEAGWEPVTYATTGKPDIWVERFGSGHTIYFTVFNAGKQTADVALHIDRRALGAVAGAKVEEVLPGVALSALQPEQVAVIKLRW